MSDSETDEKLYSQIIYRSRNDQDLQDMLNRRGRSTSPNTRPKWTPELSYEERIRRKKVREDDYVQQIYPEERPILLVKKKHVYKNAGNPNIIGAAPDEDPAFKISKNTQILEDLDEDITEHEKRIRRFTMVHDMKKGRDKSPRNKSVYKVEGVEYLPEGFLELDPLLLKDEFSFDTRIFEQMFLEEQRRLKALRRRQYAEKNYLKRRDVTIFVIDQYKDKVVEFLDLWFDKYNRRMSRSELGQVAGRLNTSLENISELQDLYLRKKVFMHSKLLREYFSQTGRGGVAIPNGSRVPVAVRRYIGGDKRYANVESKVSKDPLGNRRWQYVPKFLKKYSKTINIANRPFSNTFKSTGLPRSRSPSPMDRRTMNGKMRTSPSPLNYRGRSNTKRSKTATGTGKKGPSENDTFYVLSKTNLHDGQSVPGSSNLNPHAKLDNFMMEFSELLRKDSAQPPKARYSRTEKGLIAKAGTPLEVDRYAKDRVGSSDIIAPKMKSLSDNKNGRAAGEVRKGSAFGSDGSGGLDEDILDQNLKKVQNNLQRDQEDLIKQMPQMTTNDGQIPNLAKMDDERLRLHFDTEINKILDKIRNAGASPKGEPYRKSIAGKKSKEELSVVEYQDSRQSNEEQTPPVPRSNNKRLPNTSQKALEFMDLNITPAQVNQMDDFLTKIPRAQVELSKEQRQRLIQVLKGSCDEDEDILLSLDAGQTKEVVGEIIGGDNVSAVLDSVQIVKIFQDEDKVTLFPKDFFPLVNKAELEESRIKAYPKAMFDRVKFKPMMLRKPISENGNQLVKDYGKTVGDLIEDRLIREEEEEIRKNEEGQNNDSNSQEKKDELVENKEEEEERLAVYPQQMFDLVQAIGATKGDKDLLEKANEIFPSDMVPLLEEQAARMEDSSAALYPEEIFEIGDQEKVLCERVALFASQIMQTVNDEAMRSLEERQKNHDKSAVVLYPEGLHQLINRKFGNLIELEEEQKKKAVDELGGNTVGQVVLSDKQLQGLLERLEAFEEKDDQVTSQENDKESVGKFFLNLEPDQILDIMNQNCRVKGVEISLNPDQVQSLKHEPQTVRPALQGAEYYDCDSNTLVDMRGNRLELDNLSPPDKASILDHLKEDRFAPVLSKPVTGQQHNDVKVIEESFYDPTLDAVIDHRDDTPVYPKNKSSEVYRQELRDVESKNLIPLEPVLSTEPYYDAVVDEMVDRSGDRHGLKDLTMQQVQDLVDQNGTDKLPVVVQPEKKTALLLENVWYLPVEDSLMNGKGHKTVLTDLRPEERLRLIENLGARKGVPIDQKTPESKKRDGNKKRGSGNLLNENRQRDLDDLLDKMRVHEPGSPNSKNSPQSKKKKVRNYSSRDPNLRDTMGSLSRGSPKASVKSNKRWKNPQSEEDLVKEKFIKNAKKTGKKKKKKSKEKDKKEAIEPVLVRDLRDSQKNPLLKKLMEDEKKKSKKKKKKKKGGKKKKSDSAKDKEDEMDTLDEFGVTETEKEFDGSHHESAELGQEIPYKKRDDDMNSEDINEAIDKMSEGELVSHDEGDTIDKLREDDVAKDSMHNNPNQLNEFEQYDTFNKKDSPDRAVIDNLDEPSSEQQESFGLNDNDQPKQSGFNDMNAADSEEQLVQDAEESKPDQEPGEELMIDQTFPQKLASGPEESGMIESDNPSRTFTNEKLVRELVSETPTEKDRNDSINPDSKRREEFGGSSNDRENSFEAFIDTQTENSPTQSAKRSKKTLIDSKKNSAKRSSKAKPRSKKSSKSRSKSPERPKNSDSRSPKRAKESEAKSPQRKLKISESGRVLNIEDSTLRKKVEQVFQQERQKMSDEILQQCREVINRKTGELRRYEFQASETEDENLLDDFFLFCKNHLPSDPKYKESMMFVSLFYYYLDRNNMLKKVKKKGGRRSYY